MQPAEGEYKYILNTAMRELYKMIVSFASKQTDNEKMQPQMVMDILLGLACKTAWSFKIPIEEMFKVTSWYYEALDTRKGEKGE